MGYAIFGLTFNGEEVTCHHERTNRGNNQSLSKIWSTFERSSESVSIISISQKNATHSSEGVVEQE
jgi:hypothetical protein